MARNMKTIKESHIDFFIKESIAKGVNSVKLIDVKVKIGYNSYKSFKNTCNERSGIYILRLSLLKISINYKPRLAFNKVLIFIYFISKNPHY
jgi:hypothetical protein